MIARLNHRAALILQSSLRRLLLAVAGTGDSAPRCYIVGRFQLIGNNIVSMEQPASPGSRPFLPND